MVPLQHQRPERLLVLEGRRTGWACHLHVLVDDVVVTDKKGQPVTGLTAADFRLLEDGKPQQVESFESVVLPEQPPTGPPPERPRVSTNLDPDTRLARTFVLCFDDIHMSAAQASRAKAAMAGFLKTGVREGDRVSLVATSGSAWWSTSCLC